MSASHHAEIFLQARRGVGHGYGQTSALPATPADGSVTSTNEPEALIFQSHDQKKG